MMASMSANVLPGMAVATTPKMPAISIGKANALTSPAMRSSYTKRLYKRDVLPSLKMPATKSSWVAAKLPKPGMVQNL